MAKFIGDRQISEIAEEGDVVIVHFKDGGTDRLAKKMFEVSTSRKSIPPTELWDRQLTPVAKDVLELLLEWDVQLEQVGYLFNQFVQDSVNHSIRNAEDRLWGKKREEKRMSDVNEVLLNNDEESNNNS